LSMLCKRAHPTTNRSERRTSRSAWPAPRGFLQHGQLVVFRTVVQRNGLLTFHRGRLQRELRLHQPLQHGPRFVCRPGGFIPQRR
jgi:hypothetical protein